METKIDDFIITREWAVDNEACIGGIEFLDRYFLNGGKCKDVLEKCTLMGKWEYLEWLFKKLGIPEGYSSDIVISKDMLEKCMLRGEWYSLNWLIRKLRITNLTIPDGVNKICKYAFIGCVDLTVINIPRKIKLDDTIFYSCSPKIIKCGEYRWFTKIKNIVKGNK